MKVYESVKKSVTVMEMQKIQCNKCGITLKHLVDRKQMTMDEVVSIEHTFGYFSQHDGQNVKIDVCESCFFKFVESCKIPPTITTVAWA